MDKWTHCLALMNVNCCCLCHCVPSVMPDRYTAPPYSARLHVLVLSVGQDSHNGLAASVFWTIGVVVVGAPVT